jgi:hypothetical protein
MKTLKWNGEKWWVDARPAHLRLRQWVSWFGGWETVNRDDREYPYRHRWQFRYPFTVAGRGGQQKLAWRDPFPLSLFGHRLTFFGWGGNCRIPGHRILTWTYRRGQRQHFRAYISTDGTPRTATHWLKGWTHEDALEPPGYRYDDEADTA